MQSTLTKVLPSRRMARGISTCITSTLTPTTLSTRLAAHIGPSTRGFASGRVPSSKCRAKSSIKNTQSASFIPFLITCVCIATLIPTQRSTTQFGKTLANPSTHTNRKQSWQHTRNTLSGSKVRGKHFSNHSSSKH